MSDRPSYNRSTSGDYRPAQPSSLRRSHRPSSISPGAHDGSGSEASPSATPIQTASPGSAMRTTSGGFFDETTPLVTSDRRSTVHPAHGGVCTHGTFSPRPESPTEPTIQCPSSDGSTTPGSGTKIPFVDNAITSVVGHDDWKKWLKKCIRTRKMGQSSELAEAAGIQDTPLMFVHLCAHRMKRIRLTGAGTCPTTSPV